LLRQWITRSLLYADHPKLLGYIKYCFVTCSQWLPATNNFKLNYINMVEHLETSRKMILKNKYCIHFAWPTKITLRKPALNICDHTEHCNSTMTTAGLVHAWEVCISVTFVQWGPNLTDPEWMHYLVNTVQNFRHERNFLIKVTTWFCILKKLLKVVSIHIETHLTKM
jgi:hypothetical protein